MFQITDTTEVTLATFTKREETHGDEKVAAVSVTLELTGANTLLDAIDPSIRQALYKAVEAGSPVQQLREARPDRCARWLDALR